MAADKPAPDNAESEHGLGRVPWLSLLVYAVLLFGTLFAFAELAGEVYEKERFAFDTRGLIWLFHHQTPLLTGVALALSWLGNIFVLGPVVLVLTWLFWRKSRRAAGFFALGVVGALVLNLAAKAFFARARPDLFAALSPTTYSSFPSGHAMGSTAFALALYLLVRHLYPRWRWQVATVGFLFALGVGLSRPYLQVHYPSDIVAGWALSTAWVLGVYVWYARLYRPNARRADAVPDDVPLTER